MLRCTLPVVCVVAALAVHPRPPSSAALSREAPAPLPLPLARLGEPDPALVVEQHAPAVTCGALGLRLTAAGSFLPAERRDGAVVFRAADDSAALVYRPMPRGMKEDLVVRDAAAFGDGVFGWLLEHGEELEPRLEEDGSIGVYGSRRVARLPAPVAHDADGRAVTARFELQAPFISVRVARPERFPVTIDPTLVLTTDAEFRQDGKDEGLVRFQNNQVQRDAIGGWRITTFNTSAALPSLRSYHAFVVVNKRLYTIGGKNGGTFSSDVSFATINDDGTLGAWTSTTPYPTTIVSHTAAAYNGYIYVMGGTPNDLDSTIVSDVRYAKVNPDGTLGAWQSGPGLSGGRAAHGSAAHNGYLYVIAGKKLGGAATTDVLVSTIRADGSLSAWTATTAAPGFRIGGAAGFAFAYDGHLYTVGGHNGSFNLPDTNHARINADGTLSSWMTSAPLNNARSSHGVAVAGGHVFAIGHAVPVEGAPILPGGGVGPWTASFSLTTNKDGLAVTSFNDRILIGGGEFAADINVLNAVPARGHVPAWTATTSFANPRSAHGAVAYNGRLYVVGGAGLATGDVQFAPLNADGTVGAFAATTALPTWRSYLSVVASRGYLYVIGGDTPTGIDGAVLYASINADGSLGAWTASTSLPDVRYAHAAVALNGYLYVLGGAPSGTNNQNTVFFAPINGNGTVGAWTSTSAFATPRRSHMAVAYSGRIYLVGGNPGSNTATTDVQVATANSDGTLSAWTAVTGMNTARAVHGVGVLHGHLFAVGGGNGPVSFDTVESAPINADGSLGTWTGTTPFSGPRNNHAVAVNHGHLYLVGGDTGTLQNDVQIARPTTSGTVGTWSTAATLPSNRRNCATVANNGYLYVLGGDDLSTYAGNSLFAPINADGTLGAWTTTTFVSPPRRMRDNAAVHGGFAYIVGGDNGSGSPNPLGDAYFASINPTTGALGTWTSTSSLNTPRRQHGVVAYKGWLYAIAGTGGVAPGSYQDTVERAPINADGTLGAWSFTASLPAVAGDVSPAIHNGRIYVMVANTTPLGTIYSAAINADGTLAGWVTEVRASVGTYEASLIADGGHLYFFGGTFCQGDAGITPHSTYAESASLLSTGRIGAWTGTTKITTSRRGNVAVAHRGFAYVVGGSNDSGFASAVEVARLRTPAARATWSRLIDLGADGTVSTVTTNGGGSNGVARLTCRIAPESGAVFGPATTVNPLTFGSAVTVNQTGRYLWLRCTLDDTGSDVVNVDATAKLAIDDITVVSTAKPNVPTSLAQFQVDGITAIPVGKGANTITVVFRATVSDPDAADTVRLRVEVQPVGTPFTGTATAQSVFVANGATASLNIDLSPGTQYHWQCWAEDNGGAAGNAASFGGNLDPGDTDFFIDQAPGAPTGMGQFESDGVTVIANGGTAASTTVVLKANRPDPDALSLAKLQLEFRLNADAFTSPASPTIDNLVFFETAFGAPGSQGSITVSGLAAPQDFKWQMRVVDDTGLASAWTPFNATTPNFSTANPNVAPDAPAALAQFQSDGTTPIGIGGQATSATVKLQGALSDPNPGDLVKIQIEIRAVGVAFTSPASPVIDSVVFFETALAAQGTVQATVTLPADGAYHWQARTVDNAGTPAASAWTPFGGNADPGDTDHFLDLVNDAPTIDPATVNQFQSDGTTVLAVGGSATNVGVVIKATVVDPNGDPVTLEVELRDIATGFTPAATHIAGPFASGSTISIVSGALLDGSYHWRYRATDGTDASAWTSFGGNPDGSADFSVAANAAPSAPSALAQFKSDGVTPLGTGASTTPGTVVLQATITDLEALAVKLQVEVKPIGAAFDGTSLVESALVPSGSTVQVTVPGLADGAYHWRARAVDAQAATGAFAGFGGNPETDPDFRVDVVDDPPGAPFAIGQYLPPGDVGIALGGSPVGRTVIVRAMANEPEIGEISLQVELQPVGTPFTNTPTHLSAAAPPGAFATVTLSDLAGGAYHWQIRAIDGSAQTSAWVSYGSNSESSPDFVIEATTAVPPNSPIGVQQRTSNGLAAINVGDTIAQAAVLLRATVVHPRTEIVKLQVEVKPLAQGFTGVPDRESDFVDSGSTADVLIFGLPNDGFHWQARAVDSKGTPSPWLSFGGNAESDADFVVSVPANLPANAPLAIEQVAANGVSGIAVGAATANSTIAFLAFLSDPEGDSVRLEVEVKPVGIAFDGKVTGSGAFVASGTNVVLLVGGIPDGRHHWRARATDANGASSAWAGYGGNAESDADFIVNAAANAAPSPTANLAQLREGGSIAIGTGTLVGPETITFRSDADDADNDLVRLEVEVRGTGGALASVPTHSGGFVPQGFVADALVDRFVIGTSYRWQARVVDVNGNASAWAEFGGNGGDADFIASVSIAGGGSRKTCGSIGLDLLLPLGVLALLRRRRR